MEVKNYFGPPLVKIKVEECILDELIQYSDQILKKDVIPEKLNVKHKLASAVNSEFKLRTGVLQNVEDFIIECGMEYHRRFGNDDISELGKLYVHSMWIVSQKESEWNYLHSHTGHISGVMYLRFPVDPGHGLAPDDKRSQLPGGISFVEGSTGLFHKRLISLKPAEGELYLFPSTMLHTVYPFFGAEERRSFSFNLTFMKG